MAVEIYAKMIVIICSLIPIFRVATTSRWHEHSKRLRPNLKSIRLISQSQNYCYFIACCLFKWNEMLFYCLAPCPASVSRKRTFVKEIRAFWNHMLAYLCSEAVTWNENSAEDFEMAIISNWSNRSHSHATLPRHKGTTFCFRSHLPSPMDGHKK